MNAPFQTRPGLRDPFTAFVCDDATADMLRPVAVEHGWSPEKVNKGGLRNAVQSLSVSASPNILFVDLSESADPLNDINALAEVCEPGTIVIAAGTVNDVRLYRDLVASGIHDYLLKPFDDERFRKTIARVRRRRESENGGERSSMLNTVLAQLERGARALADSRPRILAESGSRMHMLDVAQVELVEADRNYVKLTIGRETFHATARATDELAARHRLRRELTEGPRVLAHGKTLLAFAVCRATHPDGRVATAAVSTVSRMTGMSEPITHSARVVGMPRAAIASEQRNSRIDERSTARPSPMRE